MRSRVLTREVVVGGKDFFGRPSFVSFSPSGGSDWQWQPGGSGALAIDPSITGVNAHRLCLRTSQAKLEVYEHIGVLRYSGLQGVTVRSSAWPPYHGRAWDIWDELRDRVHETAGELPWYTVAKTVGWQYPKSRNGHHAFTELRPAKEPGVVMDISFSYAGIGSYSRRLTLPNPNLFEEICRARSQGWSLRQYYLSKMASCLGWPHHRSITWPKETYPGMLLDLFLLHRAQDILGALSMLCRDGLFGCHVVSCCSGHVADLHVIKKAEPFIVRI